MSFPAANYLVTIRDLLRFAISQFEKAALFYGHGSPCAFDEAVYLILFTLRLPLDQLEPFLDAKLLPDEINEVLRVIHTRTTTRQPAAYLTQEAWLQHYRFYINEHVLIPRSFIAELLIQNHAWLIQSETLRQGLDLCTGSGCLAIIMADQFPQLHVDAVDLSEAALQVARKNVQDYQLTERINLIHSDLFEHVPEKKYDLIISNPPYVDAASMATLPKEYLHEPQMALHGGDDGLDLIHRILQQALHFLTPTGILIMEIGHNRAVLEQAYPRLPFTWLTTGHEDNLVFSLTYDTLNTYL